MADCCTERAEHHHYTDPTGVHWVHPGATAKCEAPECHLPPSASRYRVADGERVFEAMGYVLASLSGMAAGVRFGEAITPGCRRWAQGVLDRMVAEGYIEPGEVQS